MHSNFKVASITTHLLENLDKAPIIKMHLDKDVEGLKQLGKRTIKAMSAQEIADDLVNNPTFTDKVKVFKDIPPSIFWAICKELAADGKAISDATIEQAAKEKNTVPVGMSYLTGVRAFILQGNAIFVDALGSGGG